MPLQLGYLNRFFLFLKIMKKNAVYTFAFESSGILYTTDLIPEVGNVFNYWGYKWIVTSVNEEDNHYNVETEKYKL
jgi:hypothetical protein